MRAQQGDEAAFAAITETVYEHFLQVAYRILHDRHVAEDATQQALVRMWRKLPRLRDPARFEAWSYRLLVNACYSEAKRVRRWESVPMHIGEPTIQGVEQTLGDRDQLERAFARLSVEERAVVVLHHYLGMTTAEVARTIGIPFGTATSRLGRAMAKLRHALGAETHQRYAPSGETTS
jgi:RNA polymerase sigma-70 factor (ECF subfamily)